MAQVKRLCLVLQHWDFTALQITIHEERDVNLGQVKSQRITRSRTFSLGDLVIQTLQDYKLHGIFAVCQTCELAKVQISGCTMNVDLPAQFTTSASVALSLPLSRVFLDRILAEPVVQKARAFSFLTKLSSGSVKYFNANTSMQTGSRRSTMG